MDEQYTEAVIENSVKKRLILAGLRELEEHGYREFSLRRAALAAQVSCAAPYRHFKDKDELIRGVISFVAEDYGLLARQIAEVFVGQSRELVIQLAGAAFRFWLANSHFRMAMLEGTGADGVPMSGELERFDAPICAAVAELAKDRAEELSFTVLSLIYGAVDLVSSGRFPADRAPEYLRGELERVLPKA